jgi:ParB family chromosome partitioning protein
VSQIPLDQIVQNPYQTRRKFDEDALIELTESIKANGVVQPIVVRQKGGRYVLVLGERRLRAAKRAGKTTIPAIVRTLSDQQAAEITLVENLQREDLNCLEQAEAFGTLSKEFGLTQGQIGDRVGLSRESVSNYMRLLKLPDPVRLYLQDGTLGFSEARELLTLPDDAAIEKMARQAVEKHWSYYLLVDAIEAITLKMDVLPQPEMGRARWVDPNVRAAQRELETILGVRVRIRDRKGKGRIVIEYATLEDYDRVVGMLRGKGGR